MKAFCFRSGEIYFGPVTPKSAIVIASGAPQMLRDKVRLAARRAYDGHTLLVPGVPEAFSDEDAVEALRKFLDWIAPSFAEAGLTVTQIAPRIDTVREEG